MLSVMLQTRREQIVDSNNPAPAQNTPPPPVAPPPAAPAPVQPPQESSNNKKMIILLLGGLVIVGLLVGGIYWYLSTQQATKTIQPVTEVPKAEDTLDALDRDIQAVRIEDIEDDFTSVDSDLQNL